MAGGEGHVLLVVSSRRRVSGIPLSSASSSAVSLAPFPPEGGTRDTCLDMSLMADVVLDWKREDGWTVRN